MKSVANNLVEIRDSRFGKGIFAKQFIPANTPIFKITGKVLSKEDTIAMGENECYSLQIDMDKYILPGEPFLFSNHSCCPNSGIKQNLVLTALKDIRQDEEITWDYSTSMLERRWTMECLCGSESCRHTIVDFDLIPREIQLKYLSSKIVLPFICRYLSQKDITDYTTVNESRLPGKMLTTWGNQL